MNHLEKARNNSLKQAYAIRRELLHHAQEYNDRLASDLVEPFLYRVALTDEHRATKAVEAGRTLMLLPESRESQTFRDRPRHLPETRRKLWQSALRGVLETDETTRIVLVHALLTPWKITRLGETVDGKDVSEEKILKECVRDAYEHLNWDQAQKMMLAMRKRPTPYSSIVFRGMLQAITRSDYPLLFESMVDYSPIPK